MLNTFCGSPPYAAPELFKDEHYDGPPVDIWAMGIMLFFMVTGVMPFRADTVAKLKKCILDGNFTIPSFVSSNCSMLIRNILKSGASERHNVEQIKSSLWLKGQEFPDAHHSYHLTPCFDQDVATDEEQEVLEQLKQLGLNDNHLASTKDKDSRNSITGTYRILLHRVQRKYIEPTSLVQRVSSLRDKKNTPSKKKSGNRRFKNKPSKLCMLL